MLRFQSGVLLLLTAALLTGCQSRGRSPAYDDGGTHYLQVENGTGVHVDVYTEPGGVRIGTASLQGTNCLSLDEVRHNTRRFRLEVTAEASFYTPSEVVYGRSWQIELSAWPNTRDLDAITFRPRAPACR